MAIIVEAVSKEFKTSPWLSNQEKITQIIDRLHQAVGTNELRKIMRESYQVVEDTIIDELFEHLADNILTRIENLAQAQDESQHTKFKLEAEIRKIRKQKLPVSKLLDKLERIKTSIRGDPVSALFNNQLHNERKAIFDYINSKLAQQPIEPKPAVPDQAYLEAISVIISDVLVKIDSLNMPVDQKIKLAIDAVIEQVGFPDPEQVEQKIALHISKIFDTFPILMRLEMMRLLW